MDVNLVDKLEGSDNEPTIVIFSYFTSSRLGSKKPFHFYRVFFGGSSETVARETRTIGAIETSDKLTVMEKKIKDLEHENQELRKQLTYNRNKEAALQKVLINYDNLLKKALMEKRTVLEENETVIHLANLESAFYDLLRKYENAKRVVQGFQQNENVLKQQVSEYESILECLRDKFELYKSTSDNKLRYDGKGKKRRVLTSM